MRLIWYLFRWMAVGAILSAAAGYLIFQSMDQVGTHYETTGVLFALPGALGFLLIGYFIGVFRDNRSGL